MITSTQDGGSAITVDSTRPNAVVNDKNSTSPSGLTKVADAEDYNIGDTITYTVKFMTANWNGAGENAQKITSYGINTHRLLVRGHRIDNLPQSRVIRVTADAMQLEPLLVAPVVAVPILLLLLLLALLPRKTGFREDGGEELM